MQTSAYPSNPNTAAPKDTATAAKDFAAAAKSDISNVANSAVQSIRDFANESSDAAAKRFDATSKWVATTAKEKPLLTLGIAALAGALAAGAIAAFLGRR